MLTELDPIAYTMMADRDAILVQANRHAGNTANIADGWELNRDRIIERMAPFVVATARSVYMKPMGVSGFVDLDKVSSIPDVVTADGFTTTNQELILQANPADCGELAISGFSTTKEMPAIALLHVNRVIAGQDCQLGALDYFCTEYGIEPANLSVYMSPSARKESYAFPYIGAAQLNSEQWAPYIDWGEDGRWHVDFHGKTVDALSSFGIPSKNMTISPVDTIADPDYFSNYNYARVHDVMASNGLFYALRK